MNKQEYIQELNDKLTHMYQRRKSKIGDTRNETEWLKGYMRAGVTLGVVDGIELNEVIYSIQVEIFGRKLDDKKNHNETNNELIIDESIYDIPAAERKRRSK